MAVIEDDNLIVGIDRSWSNDFSMGITGFIIGKNGSIDEVVIFIGGAKTKITAWHPRLDLAEVYPSCKGLDRCGFSVHLPRIAEHHICFNVRTSEKAYEKIVDITGNKPAVPAGFPSDGGFSDFISMVNDNHLKILEIGSRVVGNSTRRTLFSGASSYTGFDYYPDSNTDVVGDAHKLSSYFSMERFDAIFSDSVFEHLAMPWLVVMEINKLLEIGGVTFHSTPFSWPLHERPWDFWRISDAGLRVLFSKPFGFEVLKLGLNAPLHMYFDDLIPGQEQFPFAVSFGNVSVLAKKVDEINSEKIKWDVALEDVLDHNCFYPNKP
jgi:hypothetical protein